MFDPIHLCSEVKEAVIAVGKYLGQQRSELDRIHVSEKSPHNFVTDLDVKAEQMLCSMLQPLVQGAGFITEEKTSDSRGEQYNWVIDPLDGTTNFIHNVAPYCVSVALRDGDDLMLGVVYEVCRDECFHAIRGGDAFLNGQRIEVSQAATVDKAFVALGLPYSSEKYKPTALQLVDSLYGRSAGCRIQGAAAVELCYVACGRFDGRIEACLGEWDVSAGGLILKQAGGCITDFKGGQDWTSGREVLASNGKIHRELLAMLNKK